MYTLPTARLSHLRGANSAISGYQSSRDGVINFFFLPHRTRRGKYHFFCLASQHGTKKLISLPRPSRLSICIYSLPIHRSLILSARDRLTNVDHFLTTVIFYHRVFEDANNNADR